jgi:Rad3-related DNA helicase
VIFDEAHNMEDVSRSTAGFVTDFTDIEQVMRELSNLISNNIYTFFHKQMLKYLNKLFKFINGVELAKSIYDENENEKM